MAVSFPEAGSSTAVAAPHRVGGAVANRLARRDVRAHKGRSALIVLMVAIPLILLTAIGSILVGSYHQTPQLVTEMNQATFKVVPLAGANGKCHAGRPALVHLLRRQHRDPARSGRAS